MSHVSMSPRTDLQRQVALTLNPLWDRQQDAGNKRFTVVRLLENSDLLAKT